jgi:hypothetical protein
LAKSARASADRTRPTKPALKSVVHSRSGRVSGAGVSACLAFVIAERCEPPQRNLRHGRRRYSERGSLHQYEIAALETDALQTFGYESVVLETSPHEIAGLESVALGTVTPEIIALEIVGLFLAKAGAAGQAGEALGAEDGGWEAFGPEAEGHADVVLGLVDLERHGRIPSRQLAHQADGKVVRPAAVQVKEFTQCQRVLLIELVAGVEAQQVRIDIAEVPIAQQIGQPRRAVHHDGHIEHVHRAVVDVVVGLAG